MTYVDSLLFFSPLLKKHRMITYVMPDTVPGTKDNTLNQEKKKRCLLCWSFYSCGEKETGT